jgi:hypothetical protein
VGTNSVRKKTINSRSDAQVNTTHCGRPFLVLQETHRLCEVPARQEVIHRLLALFENCALKPNVENTDLWGSPWYCRYPVNQECKNGAYTIPCAQSGAGRVMA